MYKRLYKILEALNVVSMNPATMNLEQLKETVSPRNLKTVLPADFFEAFIAHLPDWENGLQKGNWVQIGVWKGGGALFLKAAMQELANQNSLYLFDTFGNIPSGNLSKEQDKSFLKSLNITEDIKPYKAQAEDLFKQHGLQQNVFFIEGDITTTLAQHPVKDIALLHIDVDFYEPTLTALQQTYKNVVPGGIIIIDDYYLNYVNCKDAVDDFFATATEPVVINRLSSYAAYIVKGN